MVLCLLKRCKSFRDGEILVSLFRLPLSNKDKMVYTFYQVKEESIKSRFDGKIIKGMMDIQLVTELKDSLHNYDGGLAIERRDSGRIKY